ncbi:5-oxoprolinase subunit PxpA [Poritiphilus flavus]|uniref:5-oxoprolinase subunit PxpA n=1 Tax=Poritiphilus flavus TaxID=2697053 RepID=A0A6L9EEE2_9FLAO|nr:5-oxoprolinase subunit PxpA [Poritiphilus flavus]NAS13086.1 5-oxoprolinase subunit PxpA [Poritiphilus flavus]
MEFEVDLNCDLGEGLGNEAELMPYLSSCNIACGGHAGDEETLREVLRLARKYNVKAGAHPSYPDRENFGRISMVIAPDQLKASIQEQVELFLRLAEQEDVPVHHIKPHGALYNDIAKGQKTAEIFLKAIEPYKQQSMLYLPCGSKAAELARKRGFRLMLEAFGDRNYNADLSLVSRKDNHALITEPKAVLHHMLRMIRSGEVLTVNGETVKIKPNTFCIHGDTPSALQILVYLSTEFPKHHIRIKK